MQQNTSKIAASRPWGNYGYSRITPINHSLAQGFYEGFFV
ncbi:hypothetical protein O59_000117 [Cellvibrio sp. BR]|nr:hypothetical protein O59_000117 [Cellvibrio sp. BR]